MPTKTFFNLPKEKQDNLIQASEKEFSRVLFNEASINQIIQDAKIPRGSFYMYFQDKEDLYFYILEKHMMEIFKKLLERIQIKNGDVILAWETLYDELIESGLSKGGTLLKNLFLNMRYTTNKKIFTNPPKEKLVSDQKKVIQYINRYLYKKMNDDELMDSLSLIFLITTSSLAYIFLNPEKKEEEKKNYHHRIHMIQYGMYR